MIQITHLRAWNGAKMMSPKEIAFIPGLTQKALTLEDILYLLTKDYSVMLGTGIYDKNKKEIYFGDIVKVGYFDSDDPEESFKGTALIADSMSGGAGILYDYLHTNPSDVWAVSEGGELEDIWEDESVWDLEVIGNCVENPKLLKKYE